jgi:AcrR family transcriptional regulator
VVKPDPQIRPGKKGGKRDQNRKQKVKTLCDAAIPLFVERGLEPVTIDEITKAAGVAKGSFYRYFENKAQLVATLFAPMRERVERAFDVCDHNLDAAKSRAELVEAYEHLAEALVELVFEQADLVRVYLAETRAPRTETRAAVQDIERALTDRAVAISQHAMDLGLLRSFPSSVSTRAVIGAIERLVLAVLDGEDIGDPLELTEHLTSLVLEGIRGPNAPGA